jgi:pilus assembly protein CpaE
MSRFRMTALLISPDRKIASQICTSAAGAGTFAIGADLRTYPAPETIETRVRQMRAEVLLIDVATSLETAAAIIRQASSLTPQLPVIALHATNDAAAVLRSLRCGAHEFFHAPFEASVQEAAITRLSRLLEGPNAAERERGRLIVFTGAKAGSGVSTLALQMAFALKRADQSRRILLADLNPQGGSLGFVLGVDYELSVLDVIRPGIRITHELWSEAVVESGGVDILPAPHFPEPDGVEPSRLQGVLEWARTSYDWVVADLPVVFQRGTLVCTAGADHTFLVCTPDLASLHLTRRAVKLLQQLEFDSSRLQVLVNRMDDKSDLSSSDLSKIFDCRVDGGLPGDRTGVMRALRDGSAVDAAAPLGRAVGAVADKLAGVPAERRRVSLIHSRRPAAAHI